MAGASTHRLAAIADASSVALEGVSKSYGTVVALRKLDLHLPEGEFLSLLGPSGCGKTTLLRLIAGFEQPSEGRVLIRNVDVTEVPPYRRDFGMVFQSYALFPHLTIAENIAFGLKAVGLPNSEIAERVTAAMGMTKLEGFADRYPRQLSGGQQQRVALARATVIRPAVLLLDEPLAALDKNLREEMQHEIRSLQRKLNITTVFVTHDQGEALTISDRIVVMSQGRIEQIGTPRDIYNRPQTAFVATFLGGSNVLKGTVRETRRKQAAIDLDISAVTIEADNLSVGQHVRVAIRPESIRLSRDGRKGGLEARIGTVIFAGAGTQFTLRCGATSITAFQPSSEVPSDGYREGETVWCHWTPESVILLNQGN